MRCFAIIIPPDSSVDQGKVEEFFENPIKFFDGAWFVANDSTPEAIRTKLGIGAAQEAMGIVASVELSDMAGFAGSSFVDALMEWRDSA